MAISKTDTGRIFLSNAEYIHITPWENEDTIGRYTFDVSSIVGDTLSFTPDDNTTEEIASEFKDDPLIENVTLGKYQFGADCIDFQNKIMSGIFKWDVGTSGALYAPQGYKDAYATVEVGFRNENVVVIAPKIRLNAKATLASMKTNTGTGNIAGTAYSATIAYNNDVTKGDSPLLIAPTGKTSGQKDTYTIQVGKEKVGFTVGEGMDTAVTYE